jgi:hypothetical protein
MDCSWGANNCPAGSPYLGPLVYCVLGWAKEMVYSVKAWNGDALFSRVMDTADEASNRQRKLQQANHSIHNRAARCVAAESVGCRKHALSTGQSNSKDNVVLNLDVRFIR